MKFLCFSFQVKIVEMQRETNCYLIKCTGPYVGPVHFSVQVIKQLNDLNPYEIFLFLMVPVQRNQGEREREDPIVVEVLCAYL